MAEPERLRTSYLIKRAEVVVRAKVDLALRELRVTPGQYAILSLLASMPEVSSAQLSREVGVTPQTMTETILAFERDGLIVRERSAQHGRILQITITPRGCALLRTCEACVTAAEAELFAAIPAGDLDHLRSALVLLLRSDGAAQS